MSLQGTKLWKKQGHFSDFRTLLFIAINIKKHSSSEKKYFNVALNPSEIQSRKQGTHGHVSGSFENNYENGI